MAEQKQPPSQAAPPKPMEEKDRKPTAEEKVIKEITERLEAAKAAQETASAARAEAEETADPEKRKAALAEAVAKEKEAKSQLKIVQRLQSGIWQGGVGGAGIGAGVGMGLGAAVGTLVGGVASVPTTALGLLAGVGAGAVHGPWFRLVKEAEEEVEEDDRESGNK